MQRNTLFFLLLNSAIQLSACSSVGGVVSKTGELVTKTGEFIGGAPEEIKTPELPSEIKIKVAKPATANVLIKATDGLAQSRINATVIQLKSPGKFATSRLSDMESDAEAALGSDFISKQTVSLKPGESRPLDFEIDSATKAIGVFASFRELNQTIWRTQLDIPKTTDTSYKLFVNIDNKLITASKL